MRSGAEPSTRISNRPKQRTAILLRSGIGPASGLPVGANLVDHPATPGFELALTPAGQLPPGDASVLTSMLRYSSGMAGTGAEPHDDAEA